MLPQDVSRGYFNSGVNTANSERQFADALLDVQRSVALQEVAERGRNMTRVYWRVAVFLAVMIAVALVLSIL